MKKIGGCDIMIKFSSQVLSTNAILRVYVRIKIVIRNFYNEDIKINDKENKSAFLYMCSERGLSRFC